MSSGWKLTQEKLEYLEHQRKRSLSKENGHDPSFWFGVCKKCGRDLDKCVSIACDNAFEKHGHTWDFWGMRCSKCGESIEVCQTTYCSK